MIVIGITGGIGSGKSTLARRLSLARYPVFDADRVAHGFMKQGQPVYDKISRHFPEVISNGHIDRAALAEIVFSSVMRKQCLERLTHPEIILACQRFIKLMRRQRRQAVILDVPLLYESRMHTMCDAVLVMKAPFFLRMQRVLQRSGMTEARFKAITQHQLTERAASKYRGCRVSSGSGIAFSLRRARFCLDSKLYP
jgi:dephospho-CoA kinase